MMHSSLPQSPEPTAPQSPQLDGRDLYRQLDEGMNRLTGVDIGYTALIRPGAYPLKREELEGFRARYELIKAFQQRTLEIFHASLKGECDPAIADLVLSDVPPHLGKAYHLQLTERQHRTPVFFRTDEPLPGKLSEVQCPGSGWCMAEELLSLYRNNSAVFGENRHLEASLAAGFARALAQHLEQSPVVHHLVENASRPHGMRYFIQRTRQHGVRYFGYDHGVRPQDCNFVRAHDFISLPHHNFFAERMQRCAEGAVQFDLPPSVLFDGKVIMSWPFWKKTREFYTDSIRALFPFTNLVTPEGFDMPDGSPISLDAYCELGRTKRDFFIKYGGSDIAINWGSKSVFLTSTLTTGKCRELMTSVASETAAGRPWVIQEAFHHEEQAPALTRDGEIVQARAHSKFSGFYGPTGLLGIIVMQKASHKVHGSGDTITSMVY